LEYDKSAISETRLEQYAEEEVAAATSLVGPHRDDMQFQIPNSKFQMKRNLATFGSRGEQRMAILWLKLAELAFIQEKTGERPTLLLDDIFSELDHPHRKIVMAVAGNQQTIITTADPHFIESFRGVAKIELKR
jgi:DNA replication and repair protein RecF